MDLYQHIWQQSSLWTTLRVSYYCVEISYEKLVILCIRLEGQHHLLRLVLLALQHSILHLISFHMLRQKTVKSVHMLIHNSSKTHSLRISIDKSVRSNWYTIFPRIISLYPLLDLLSKYNIRRNNYTRIFLYVLLGLMTVYCLCCLCRKVPLYLLHRYPFTLQFLYLT